MSAWTIHEGDVRSVLPTLPDASAQCCVTSPPYWGLRDYGTGKWDGGDPSCEHSVGGQVQDSKAPGAIVSGVRPGVDASVCRKCGATRVDSQLGLEKTPEEYVANMVAVFREVRRVLRDDGTLWLNLGDSYANDGKWGGATSGKHVAGLHGDSGVGRSRKTTGLKPKDLVGIPWMVAFALRADGWYLRSDIIWHKRAPMPESVRDRPTKAHEHVFLFAKSERYFYDAGAIAEPVTWGDHPRNGVPTHITQAPGQPVQSGITRRRRSGNKARVLASGADGARPADHLGSNVPWEDKTGTRNARDVWTLGPDPYPDAHFAVFPEEIPRRCIKAGSKPGDTILDPFSGAGTTGVVALSLGRSYVGVELNPKYADMARRRIENDAPLFNRTA